MLRKKSTKVSIGSKRKSSAKLSKDPSKPHDFEEAAKASMDKETADKLKIDTVQGDGAELTPVAEKE